MMIDISHMSQTPQPARKAPQMNMRLFGILVALLLVANWVVFFFTPLRNAVLGSPQALVLSDLTRQKNRLIELLREVCSSEAFDRFRRGEFSLPPDAKFKVLAPAEILPLREGRAAPALPPPTTPGQDTVGTDFGARLAQRTVRVISGNTSGSGFFISKELVITNRHVVEGSARGDVFVASQYFGNRPLVAKVIAATRGSTIAQPDFALLQIERPPTDVQVMEIADNPAPLDDVVAAGFPGRTIVSDENNVTPATVFSRGIVSVVQARRDGTSLIVHTADIAPGSSGGPLVNRCGQIVGVNTFINAGETPAIEGRALYALSSESLKAFLKSINQPFVTATRPCSPAIAK